MKEKNRRITYIILILLFGAVSCCGIRILTRGSIPDVKSESALPKRSYAERADKTETQEQGKDIRVLILSTGYRQITHEKIVLTSKGRMQIQYANKKESIKAGEVLEITPDDSRFSKGSVRILPEKADKKITIKNLRRGYGAPAYRGSLELYTTAEGIVIVNELDVEEYLRGVVPSEMPASYELEALKAQAVCARNYAFCQMKSYGYPEYQAHVDDSTSYQVYNNSKEQKSTNQAVQETKGIHLYYRNQIVTTYYFSTSCGRTTTQEAWGTKASKKNAYLSAIHVEDKDGNAYEKNLPWYHWSIEVTEGEMQRILELNTGTELGTLKNVFVSKTGGGGVAIQIKAIGSQNTIVVDTENKIRRALSGSDAPIIRADGSEISSGNLLPSAFFTIEKKSSTYLIEGGGFGHGIGMSQNGANEMAKKGKTYREILQLFFRDVEVR